MNWFETLKHRQSLRKFGNKARKSAYERSFIDLERAKTVAIMLNINQFNSRDLIILTDYINKLEEEGKKVYVLEMNFKRKSEPMFTESNHSSLFISLENINWLGHPSSDTLKMINKLNCDILVNLDTSEKLTSRFICGLSNAKTRVGLYGEAYEPYYELMVEIPEDISLKEMLLEIEKYLRMIEK